MGIFTRDKKDPDDIRSYLPPDVDPEVLLKDFQAQIDAIVEAVMAGEQDADLMIAELVENEQGQARIAIVEKIRQMVRERSEEKAKALDQALQQQKLLEHHQQKKLMEQWLAYFMSEETLRKIKESFLANPGAKREVEHLGQELAKKGVLQNLQPGGGKQDLGSLSANVQQGKDQGRGQGTGRG